MISLCAVYGALCTRSELAQEKILSVVSCTLETGALLSCSAALPEHWPGQCFR